MIGSLSRRSVVIPALVRCDLRAARATASLINSAIMPMFVINPLGLLGTGPPVGGSIAAMRGAHDSGDDSSAAEAQAELETAAEALRQSDPELRHRDFESECEWVAHTPLLGGVDDDAELLDRALRYADADVYAGYGPRHGLRSVRWVVPKLTRWSRRHLTGPVNIWNQTVVRWMQQTETRLRTLEATGSALTVLGHEMATVMELSDDLAAIVARHCDDHAAMVAVLGCGKGALVEALTNAQQTAYGVDPDPRRIAEGVARGLDLRSGSILTHLTSLGSDSLGDVILTEAATVLDVATTVGILAQARRVAAPGARIVVAVTDAPTGSDSLEQAWLRLLELAGGREPQRLVAGEGLLVLAAISP